MRDDRAPLTLMMAAGKSTLATAVAAAAARHGIRVEHVSFAGALKDAYCAGAGLDRATFESVRALKEAHRDALTASYDAALARDVHVFARRVTDTIASLVEKDVGIVVVEDLRRTADWEYMVAHGCGDDGGHRLPGLAAVRCVRVTCDPAARAARGWTPTSYDAHPCETEMDGWAAGAVVDNSGGPEGIARTAAALCEVYADTEVSM